MTDVTDRIGNEGAPRFRPYPEYRDSGVEWLGEIPAHWEATALKRQFRVVNGSTPKSGEPDNWDGDIPWVTPEDLGRMNGRVLQEPARYLTRKGYESCGTQMVRAGSLVLSTRAPIGHLALAGTAICTNQGCRALVFRHAADETYFYFQLRAARPVLESAGRGSTFKELASEDLESVDLAVPPPDDQRAIASFLDRETAKIDALVARKERLIELLREKRTALITRAVTRGLDPNVPMKDSGVEWLRRLPSHWTGLPLKRWVATKITDGPHETPEFLDEGVQFISADAVSGGRIDFNRRRGFISERAHQDYSRKCEPVRDDILVCKSGATTGKLAMVEVDFEFSIWSPLALVRADARRVRPRFLALALESRYVQEQIRRTWSAGTQPNISMADLEQLFIAAPSIAEQDQILGWLGLEAGAFGEVEAKVCEAIDYFKEFRTALISAAVTGKIDVREAVPDEL